MAFENEDRRTEVEQHAENAARLAEAFHKFNTTGQGSVEYGDRVNFGLTFIEEPYLSYGAQIDLDALDELLENEPGSSMPPLPITTGYVTEWDQDDRGFYVGAWVAVRVWFPYESNVTIDTEIDLQHHFTFKAVAIKDVPTEMRD